MTTEGQTISLRLFELPTRYEDRCRALARRRGWFLLGKDDTSPPDVIVTVAGLHARAEPRENAVKQGPRVPMVLLLERETEPEPARTTELTQQLPVHADDSLWVAAIENSAQMGRLLSRFHDRINHLQQISTTDALTGLYNRMHLLRVLSNEHKRYQRTGATLSCIMVDLDHFKNINDTYGHSFGDQILTSFALLLSETVRETDILGRYGGEEFLCILPNTDVEGACAVAEKLRRAVENRVFTEGFFNIELTASFGVASSSLGLPSESALVQAADRALYRAKQSGRNRVSVADDPRGEGGAERVSAAEVSTGDRPTLLIAHPEPEKLQFFNSLIEKRQFHVVTVGNSDDALKWMALHSPTAALLKSTLKPLNGWELIERIRSKTSEHYFPIAVLQSETGSSLELDEGRTGADDVFSEGIGENEFNRRIHVFFRLKLLHDRFNETYERLTGARARLVRAERLSALGQMASGVAHDFNNVLSTILGRTERLLRIYGHEPVGEELRVIQQAAGEGAKSVRRIQDFSRTISDLDSSPICVADIVEDCIQMTRARWKDEAERSGIRIAITNSVNSSLLTLANRVELREVFVKLIINAIDAMPDGGEIRVRSSEPSGENRFIIEVEDNGVGMEPKLLRRIFEPFFTTKDEGGTGLGLSIVYGIMTRLGGLIEADSRVGRGSVFRLWFPRAESEAESGERRMMAPMPVELASRRKGPSLRILVVEDEDSVRDLFVDVLTEEGYAVDEAACGGDAIALLKEKNYDAVLTDLGMPDIPGWDVAGAAKQKNGQTRVILTSGWGDNYTSEYLHARNVDHWLPKPLSLDELFSLLQSVVPIPESDSQHMA